MLTKITELLHKKKSDVIRDALDYYADERRTGAGLAWLSAVPGRQPEDSPPGGVLQGSCG